MTKELVKEHNHSLIDQNRFEFLKDMQDLFSEARFSHIGHWRFSKPLFKGDVVNGLYHWNNMLEEAKKSGQYYVFSDEVELINNAVQEINRTVDRPITLVDLGPGSKDAVQQKISPIIHEARVNRYIGIDIVQEVLDGTKRIFNKEFPNIAYQDLNADFFEQSLSLPQASNVLMVIFGITMFNLPINPLDESLGRKTIINLLKKMRGNLANGAHFIVTQDCNPNIENIIDSYKAQKAVWLNVLDRMKRDLPVYGNFDIGGFDFEPYWIAKSHNLCHTYLCKKDMSFMLGNRRFDIKSGQRFYLHNSYKYPSYYFCELAKQAGFDVSFTKLHGAGRIALHFLRAI